jgi:hypothetical protein
MRSQGPDPINVIPPNLGFYSRLAIAFAVIWIVVNRPFGRHVCVAISVMVFATALLPDQMIFFARHPALAFSVLFTAGFVGANMGRSAIRTLASWTTLAVLAVAIFRAIAADSANDAWFRTQVEVPVEAQATTASTLDNR